MVKMVGKEVGVNNASLRASICLTILLLVVLPQWVVAENLKEMLHAVRSQSVTPDENGNAWHPSKEELAQAEKLFRRLFAGESGPELRRKWAGLGFELTGTRSEGAPLLVLQEFGEGSTQASFVGKGFFAFVMDREPKTVLQVTHSFQDPETEVIALELMASGNFRAAAWNTVAAQPPVHPAFLPESFAPPAESYMVAFTKALMSMESDKRVVQLHSFEKDKMYSSSGKNADIILSGYGEQPNKAVGWFGRCLKKNMDYVVRTFPFEVQEMGAANNMAGASHNTVGEVMQAAESQNFLHISMGSVFREELRAYPSVQKKLFACFNQE